MLQDHFYHLTSTIHQENTITVALELNIEHDIFKGHFPGQPVVPGACMLQMVKEVLSAGLNKDYRLEKADNLKFIAPVDPRVTDDLQLKITYKTLDTGLQVNALMSANEVVCFKMQGVFI
jgi:3-hydroxyacyl-[acyl-carrier-protein] dehydratase